MSYELRVLLVFVVSALCACAGGQKTSITLLQLNDVYEITPLNAGKSGGLARVATMLKRLEVENPHTYGVFAGDLLSPSAMGSSRLNGEPLAGKQMIALFNHIGWDYITFGNHEFDIGREALLKRLAESRSVFFSSNVLDAKTGKPFANSQTTVLFEVDGIKLGLVGITLPELKKPFVQIEPPLQAAEKAIAELKSRQADLIVLVTHQDLRSDIQFAEKLDGIDLIVGGHEHENMHLFRGKHLVPIAKADANAKSVFVHRISIDKESGNKKIDSELVFLDENIPLDGETVSEVKKWQERVFDLFRQQGFEPERVICHIHEPLDGQEASVRSRPTALTDLIAKAYLNAYPEADVSLYNSGSIRIDDILQPGAITEYDIIKTLPFSDELRLVQMPGRLLKKALDEGLTLQGKGSFLHYANIGRVDGQWQVVGKPLDLKADYKVAIAGFLIEKGDIGLKFLTRDHSPEIKLLSDEKKNTQKLLIKELSLIDGTEDRCQRIEDR